MACKVGLMRSLGCAQVELGVGGEGIGAGHFTLATWLVYVSAYVLSFLSAILLSGDSILARSDILVQFLYLMVVQSLSVRKKFSQFFGELRSRPFWLCAIEFRNERYVDRCW